LQNDSLTQSYLLAQWITAIFTLIMALGTIMVAILAVFGEQIRARFVGPKLTISLNNIQGELVRLEPNKQAIYYHLKIENHGRSVARNVRILCYQVSKRRPDGSFDLEKMTAPEQLTWRWSHLYGTLRNIPQHHVGELGAICDLGYVHEGSDRFELSVYAKTESFPGHLMTNEAMRLKLTVSADNFETKDSYDLEISWDERWTADLNEMQKHLVVKPIQTG